MAARASLPWDRLGEGATLAFDEKLADPAHMRQSGARTAGRSWRPSPRSQPQRLWPWRKQPRDLGCDGLMVLPPYVYKGDWREMKAHVAAVFRCHAASLHALQQSCGLRNRFSCPNKFGNWRRNMKTSRRSKNRVPMCGEFRRSARCWRLGSDICVGVDDAVLEAIGGRSNGLGRRSGQCSAAGIRGLFNSGINGETEKAFELYRWFFHCCVWTRFQTSFNSSNWCRRKLGLETRVCGRHGWS